MKTLKHVLLAAIISLSFTSCTEDEGGCETETVCFGAGNCIERPIAGSSF
ncbi:hypothetical protein [Algibacter sp. L3A6]|nr:hypothetical protein [Algibacter sp. L3A6]